MSWIDTKGTNTNITARSSDVQQCLHDACPECLGTGVRRDGSSCIHGISCPCPKCTPSY